MSRRSDFRWGPELDARLHRLYAEGRTWPEIAQAFGCSRASAQAHGHRLGFKTRAKVGKAAQQPPEGAEGTVSPHRALLANGTPGRRVEGGVHVLPAGDALTWSLVMASTPVLGDPPWPE